MTEDRLGYLFMRCYHETATAQERDEFLELVSMPQHEHALNLLIQDAFKWAQQTEEPDAQTSRHILTAIFEHQQLPQKAEAVRDKRSMHFTWLKYAAAALLIVSIGAYLWNTNKNTQPTTAHIPTHTVPDMPPGGQKATLTLADGTTILLDTAASGKLANQGNTEIIKLPDGRISYTGQSGNNADVMMNTMVTPNGGQYQLMLPDGSKAWLNAASSIEFPAFFTGPTRKIKITGEVYLEIARDARHPFIVDIDKTSTIQVLGTRFNVDSYEDADAITTTLVDGSVKVIGSDREIMLRPGEQLIASSNNHSFQITNADLDRTLAWKNGLFNFNGLDIRAMMKQLARWYDVTIRYEGKVSKEIFRGEMYRDVKLSVVMERLHDMGIDCRLEGKTLIVRDSK